MKLFKHIFSFLTLIILLGFAGQVGYAQTQPDIQLDEVAVYLLPEYVHPSVLVIYEIFLDETLPLPQELIVEVPVDVQVLSVINFTSEERPIEQVYQEASIGNWKDVRFTASTHHIRIEYQDLNLIRDGNMRMYEFQWLSYYPAAALSIHVLQPLGASRVTGQPPLQIVENLPEGETLFGRNFGEVPAGELLTLSFSYTKDPTDGAFTALPVEPAMPIDQSAPGRTPPPLSVILWLVVASVAIVIIVVIYFLWYRSTIKISNERVVQDVGILNPEKQFYFCHECGMRFEPGDNFCSNCGTELRKPTPFEAPSRKQ